MRTTIEKAQEICAKADFTLVKYAGVTEREKSIVECNLCGSPWEVTIGRLKNESTKCPVCKRLGKAGDTLVVSLPLDEAIDAIEAQMIEDFGLEDDTCTPEAPVVKKQSANKEKDNELTPLIPELLEILEERRKKREFAQEWAKVMAEAKADRLAIEQTRKEREIRAREFAECRRKILATQDWIAEKIQECDEIMSQTVAKLEAIEKIHQYKKHLEEKEAEKEVKQQINQNHEMTDKMLRAIAMKKPMRIL